MIDKKELILDVARVRFDRFGVKKTTMDEISKEAGISKKTLYELFRNKEDLFVSVFIKEALNNRQWILKRVDHIRDPLEKIREVLQITVNYHWHETFMAKVLQDEDGLYAPFLKDKYRIQVEEGILTIFSDMLEAGINQRQVRDLDSNIVAYFIFKLFQSVTYARTASIKGDKKDLKEFIDFILEGIVRKQGRS